MDEEYMELKKIAGALECDILTILPTIETLKKIQKRSVPYSKKPFHYELAELCDWKPGPIGTWRIGGAVYEGGSYPTREEILDALVKKGLRDKFLKVLWKYVETTEHVLRLKDDKFIEIVADMLGWGKKNDEA